VCYHTKSGTICHKLSSPYHCMHQIDGCSALRYIVRGLCVTWITYNPPVDTEPVSCRCSSCVTACVSASISVAAFTYVTRWLLDVLDTFNSLSIFDITRCYDVLAPPAAPIRATVTNLWTSSNLPRPHSMTLSDLGLTSAAVAFHRLAVAVT